MYSLREDAEIGGLDFAFKGNDEQQNSEDNNKHGNRNERDTESSSEDNLMEFGSQGDIRDRDRDRDRDSSTASNVLGGLAAKAAKAATELSPLTNLSSMRGIYRENRELSRKSQEKVHISSLRPSLKTAVARIIEVAAGRAALIGLVATPLSEIMYRQSILSQLLGRWEGVRHVEYAIPTARILAEGVLLASLAFTAVEALVPPSGLPPRWPFTRLSPFLQLWIGRIAAMTFAALLLFEVQQSNRPAFFWFLHL